MNVVNAIGRLTKDVEIRQTQSGKAVGTFTLAVQRNFKNQNGEYEADFLRCVIWDQRAENLARFTHKGSKIGIEGRIQTRSYDDQSGKRVYITEIIVQNFHLLDPPPQNQATYQNNANNGGYNDYNPSNGNHQGSRQNAYNANISNNNNGYRGQDDNFQNLQDELPF